MESHHARVTLTYKDSNTLEIPVVIDPHLLLAMYDGDTDAYVVDQVAMMYADGRLRGERYVELSWTLAKEKDDE